MVRDGGSWNCYLIVDWIAERTISGSAQGRIIAYVSCSHHQRNQVVEITLTQDILSGHCTARDSSEIKYVSVVAVRRNPY